MITRSTSSYHLDGFTQPTFSLQTVNHNCTNVCIFQHSGATQAALPFTTVNGLDKMVDDVLDIQDGRSGEPLPA